MSKAPLLSRRACEIVRVYDKYPVHVTLCFRSEEERDCVMGQLIDGFGENCLEFQWAKDRRVAECGAFAVLPEAGMLAHYRRVRRMAMKHARVKP